MNLFVGKYEHVRSENLEEFLKEMQVPYLPRKMIVKTNPTVEIEKVSEDGPWIIRMKVAIKQFEIQFRPNQPLEVENFLGNYKTELTFEGDQIRELQNGKNGEVEIVRDFTEEGFTMTMKKSGVVAIRIFKRVS